VIGDKKISPSELNAILETAFGNKNVVSKSVLNENV